MNNTNPSTHEVAASTEPSSMTEPQNVELDPGSDGAGPAMPLSDRVSAWFSHPRAPMVVGGVVLAALVSSSVMVVKPNFKLLSIGRPDLVVFDPVRFANAQRAVASVIAVNPSADASLTLTQVAKHAEAVIREEAHGAVVLVKQTVVAADGTIPDITDAVLQRFGLPLNIPTITTQVADPNLIEGYAPTDSAFGAGRIREDYRVELERRQAQASAVEARKSQQEAVLP